MPCRLSFKAQDTQGTLRSTMSEAASDPSSPSESHQSNDAYFFWEAVTPLHGEEMFVRALQHLGIEMAKAVPERTKREAITPYGVEPTADLLTGRFVKKTKERQFQLGSSILH